MIGIILECIAIALLLGAAFTQIVVPLIMGRQTFPAFRKEGDLNEELQKVNQRVREKNLKDIINKQKETLK